jgi:FkbM family methyltransferase
MNPRLMLRKLPAPLLYRILAWKMFAIGEAECRLLKHLVPKNLTSIDIGANRGAYTYWLSRLSPKVLAFEPLTYLADFLKKVVPANVKVFNYALSSKTGEAKISIPLVNGYPVEGEATLNLLDCPTENCSVRLARLDDYKLSDIGFIKIDVEGHELELLKGARATIQGNTPVILIEIEQRHITCPISDVFNTITDLGYQGYFLYNKHLVPIQTFSPEIHQKWNHLAKKNYINNFIFLPKKSERPLSPFIQRLIN